MLVIDMSFPVTSYRLTDAEVVEFEQRRTQLQAPVSSLTASPQRADDDWGGVASAQPDPEEVLEGASDRSESLSLEWQASGLCYLLGAEDGWLEALLGRDCNEIVVRTAAQVRDVAKTLSQQSEKRCESASIPLP